VVLASGPGSLCPRKPVAGLAEDLCPARRRMAARLHHAIRAVPLPVLPAGNRTVATRTPTAGKPREHAAN